MTTLMNMTRDVAGYNSFALRPTDVAFSVTLTSSTDTSFTVPAMSAIGGTNTGSTSNPVIIAIFYFTPGAEVWCALNETAEVPAGNTFAATISEGNPSAWEVQGGDSIHVISAGSAVSVGVKLYVLS